MKNIITNKMLDMRLEWLNKALGRPLATWTRTESGCKANIGNIHLERGMSGWTIQENINEQSGITQPFGSSRHTRSEIVDIIDAALVGIELGRKAERALAPNTVAVTFPGADEAKLFADVIRLSIERATEKPARQISGVHLGILRDRAAKAVAVKLS